MSTLVPASAGGEGLPKKEIQRPSESVASIQGPSGISDRHLSLNNTSLCQLETPKPSAGREGETSQWALPRPGFRALLGQPVVSSERCGT